MDNDPIDWSDATSWAGKTLCVLTKTWGFDPEEDASISFTSSKTREDLLIDMKGEKCICFINVTDNWQAHESERKCVVGYAVLDPQRINSDQAQSPNIFYERVQTESGDWDTVGHRWPYGLRISHAYRFKPPIPMTQAQSAGIPETHRLGAISYAYINDLDPKQINKFPKEKCSIYVPATNIFKDEETKRPWHTFTEKEILQRNDIEPWRYTYLLRCDGKRDKFEREALGLLRARHAPSDTSELVLVKVGATKDWAERQKTINGENGWSAFGIDFRLACDPADHGDANAVANAEKITKKEAQKLGYNVAGEEYFLIEEGRIADLAKQIWRRDNQRN